MIKNWKLFLENNEGDEFQKYMDELRDTLKYQFSEVFQVEQILRKSNQKGELVKLVRMVTEKMALDFSVEMQQNRSELPSNVFEFFIQAFSESLGESIATMIEDSISEGIDVFTQLYSTTIRQKKQEEDSEGEDWKQEKEEDLSSMSKSEILSLIDQALDQGDEERFKLLSSYLKEAAGYLTHKEIDEIVHNVVETLVEYTIKIYNLSERD